jgi:hypothetical protein
MVDSVAQDVVVLVIPLHRRQLHGGDELDPGISGGVERLRDSFDAIVIAQGQETDPSGSGGTDYLRGR